ncbi:MAG TPA: hypothetical protein VK920_04120 [Solirubrobacterales bacterium]|nr:hypothetical protein [Solirubrobacterales bacterium]
MEQTIRDHALEPLDALVGEWRMEAGPPDGPLWPGEARVRFEWLEGGKFLIQRWTVDLPEAPDGIAIIGLRDAPASAEAVAEGLADTGAPYRQHYFDSRGVYRVYEMTLAGGEWRLWRDSLDPFAQRFTGTFGDSGRTITARWELAEDGSTWRTDFDLTYRKLR